MRGKITNAQGNAVANAEINAVETASGFVHTVHSRPDGTYTLGGLTPGLYNIVVAATGASGADTKGNPVTFGKVSAGLGTYGRVVATLLRDARTAPGPHRLEFRPQRLREGIYFCRLHAGRPTRERAAIIPVSSRSSLTAASR